MRLHRTDSLLKWAVFSAVCACLGGCGNDDDEGTADAQCRAMCNHWAAAACPNDDPNTCPKGCTDLRSSASAECKSQWDTFANCASSEEVECSSSGLNGYPPACKDDLIEVHSCLGSI